MSYWNQKYKQSMQTQCSLTEAAKLVNTNELSFIIRRNTIHINIKQFIINQILNKLYLLLCQSNMHLIPQNKFPQSQNYKPSYLQFVKSTPYEIDSAISILYVGQSTYRQFLDDARWDTNLINQLENVKRDVLDRTVFVFVGDIQPQNLQWTFWRNQEEITEFFNQFRNDINAMMSYSTRIGSTGIHIQQEYRQKFAGKLYWSAQDMVPLANFLNLVAKNAFLSKSVSFLTVIEHCMPLHLWNIKVFQQVPIYHDPSCFTKIFKNNEHQIAQFLTVVGDGIIISTKNPMDSKINQMVPFTNQFQFKSQLQSDNDLYYEISSCKHENIKVNFKKDYVGGMNFHIGTKRAIQQAGYMNTGSNRFGSFSMARKNCWTKLYNDGCEYFADMHDEIRRAKKQICITDWWMTPYFLLRRNRYERISMEHNIGDRLDGLLQAAAKRGVKVYIILFREPLGLVCNDSYDCQLHLEQKSPNIRIRRHPIVPQLWSHHEKCVIIDQRVGFMGGLDICYGRWDTPEHSLINAHNYWDAGDYTNQRQRAYAPGTTKFYNQPPIDRETQCRMPWHDIGIMLKGDAVIDLTRHFVQYWYFVDAERVKDPYNHLRNLQRRFHRASRYQQPDFDNTQDLQPEQFIDSVRLCGKRTQLFFTGTQNKLRELLVQGRAGKKKGDQQLQMCRSASDWSIGAKQYQQSIHFAYQTLINQSEHLIYIQNQFFMGNNNRVVECLAKRIRLAYENKENFKIVVVMPLLPGFQGDVSKRQNGPLRFQVNNQFQSINRGKQRSLYAHLKDLIKKQDFNIDDYIFFFGLRGHTMLNGQPMTEIIYVHSKLMIVDDKRAIIGSANINDRSLCGDRDSQLAIVIEEDNGNVLDGRPRRQGIFDLRVRLFNQHFGLTPDQTARSNSPQIWSNMINKAKNNTLIYRKLFGCYPDDTITVSAEVQQRKKQAQPQLYTQQSPKIFAHAVEFPLHFMEDEDLKYQFGDNKEGMLLEEKAFL